MNIKGEGLVSEFELIRRAALGDRNALISLIQPYSRLIYHVAYKIVLHEDDAHDVCQMVYLKLVDKIKQFKVQGHFRAWISTMTANAALDFLRWKRNWNEHVDSIDVEELAASQETDRNPREHYEQNFCINQIDQCIGLLSPQQRAIMMLHLWEDLKPKEISEALNMPAGQVRLQLYRALKKLQMALAPMYKNE